MQRVESIKQTTQNKFLNMYELDMKSDTGKHSTYFVASRAKTIEELKIKTRENKADGVIIYSVYRDEKEKKEKLVLITFRTICRNRPWIFLVLPVSRPP